MKKILLRLALMLAMATIIVTACKNDEDPAVPPTAPVVSTASPTNITATSATVGGNITANGGADVTDAGVVLSVLKPEPTTSDEKKTSATKSGAYTIDLADLASGTTYYVRAYAINSVGTSYGASVILATGNLPPIVKNVTISGINSVDQKLTGAYEYSDPENNAESGSTFKWYRADDNTGANEVAIEGATKIDYTLVPADVDKFIRIGVTPKAAAGTSTGIEVKSSFTLTAILAKPNVPPTAKITSVSGVGAVDEKLTVIYKYEDGENDEESGTTFQWYVADDASGTNVVVIDGATSATYRLVQEQLGKFVAVGVTAKSSTGTQVGAEVRSSFTGPVASEFTSVTFTYNGAGVTYGIIKSTRTQRKWLDRNLGAPNAPTAFTDYANYGDLVQWGRKADGHQLVLRAPNVGDPTRGVTTAVNTATTTTLSSTNTPADNLFIKSTSTGLFDWRSPQNNSLWQAPDYANNPCPTGWHIPTESEWLAEQLSGDTAADFAQLKITRTGVRSGVSGSFQSTNSFGQYWSSTISNIDNTQSLVLFYQGGFAASTSTTQRATGAACRCIRDL